MQNLMVFGETKKTQRKIKKEKKETNQLIKHQFKHQIKWLRVLRVKTRESPRSPSGTRLMTRPSPSPEDN